MPNSGGNFYLIYQYKSLNIRTVILILSLLMVERTKAQHHRIPSHPGNDFYLYYGISGLGANLGSFEPTLRINKNKFTYTKEQNSYFGKRSKKVVRISH